ncbi:hypothetical protein HKD37_04G010868 [Glycine soja]
MPVELGLSIGVVVEVVSLYKVQLFWQSLSNRIMAYPLASLPPPPPPSDASASPSAVKQTRKASCLRSLSTRPPGAERPVVHVDPTTGKADDPHRKKLRTYLRIVACDKVDVTYKNWKEVPTAHKDLIWEDIQTEFEILEASNSRTKKKLLQTVSERWRQFKSDLTRKWALAADQDGVDDTICEKYGISKEKWAQFFQTHRDPSWEKKAQAIQKQNTAPHVLSRGGYEYLEQKLLAEKTKKKMEEAAQLGSIDGVIDPPSPVRHHMKWKMAHTKKTWEMTTEAAKEFAAKIVSHFQLTIRIISLYLVNAMSKRHRDPSSPMDIRMFSPQLLDVQSTLDVSVLLEPVSPSRNTSNRLHGLDLANQGPARGVDHKKSDSTAHGIVQPDAVSVSVIDAISGTCTTSGAFGWSLKSSSKHKGELLYIEANPARLVALGRLYEGSTIVHNTSLLPGQVKVGVEKVKDPNAPVPVPTNEVSLVGQAIHTFLSWQTHLVKPLSQQVLYSYYMFLLFQLIHSACLKLGHLTLFHEHAIVSLAKPPENLDPEVDDPLYLMTLTIPELFLRPYQVTWDATMFGVFNLDFLLYIKHEDLFEIAHGGQCLNISVLQLWILHLTETSMRAGIFDMYGFLESQSIQRSGQSQFETESYIKSWMQSSKRDVYLGAYLNGALIGLDDALQPKSKAPARWIVIKCNRQKGSTECSYYVMHWMSTIILGIFRNNWEAYFNNPRPLKLERLKALQIQRQCLLVEASQLAWASWAATTSLFSLINRGKRAKQIRSTLLVFRIHLKLVRKIVSVKKIQAQALLVVYKSKGETKDIELMGNSAKFVIQQDMKGRRHKYGFNNNEREKAQKKRVVDDETADKHQLDEIMGSPPASTTPPPPPPPSPPSPPRPPPTSGASASTSAVKRTRKASRLRSLSTRPPSVERPVVHVDPATGKADGPHKKKLRTYLGIVARDKVDITYENWKEVPTAQKDLIWEDIQTVGERWRQFKSNITRKWALAADQDGVEDTVCDKYDISKEKWAQFCQTRRDPSWEDVRIKAQAIQKQNTAPTFCLVGKLLAEKTKKKMQEAAQSGSVDGIIDPPSLVRRHVKWKMAHTKKTGEMTTEVAKEIAERLMPCTTDSFEEQATQGSFVPHGRQDVLAAAIGRPEHPGRVRAAGAGVTIKQYFGSAPWTSRSASSLPPDELQQLTQQIRDQLEESITEKVTRQVMASFSQLQSQMQSQGPPEPLVGPGPSGPRVSTKGSCVDPSRNDPETGDSDRCGLYIEADPARLVAVGRVYEGSTLVHNTPLLSGQVKVSVDEVKDADVAVPVPTAEVSLVGQALHTFLAWPTHLIKSLSNQVAVSPPKPPPKPDSEVRWDATVFGVVNPDFPLYIKHEDLSEIAHGGQCLSISVLQLWILHLTETCMRAGNSDIYGFLEPQSIQRSGQSQFESESYIKSWMQSSQRDVYLGAYLNGPDNYLKGIINSAIKGLDDAPQPKSKAPARWIVVKCNRQKGTTECGYYVMHWMSTIILGSFRNNWEAYFNDPRPLEPERLKALRIQWVQFYLREYARSRHQRLFEENIGKTGKDAIYELLSERFGSCIYARGRLPNDGCQAPHKDQTKVACHQAKVPGRN